MKTITATKAATLSLVLGLSSLAGIAQAQCDVQPIALSEHRLASAQEGQEIRDILDGVGRDNFGWLTWNGDLSDQALVLSLAPEGNSDIYINPLDGDNELLLAGDWVEGKPGPSDTRAVREALDTLETTVIIVPVWDKAEVVGRHTYYHIAEFANVQITEYHLFHVSRISAIFLGYSPCNNLGS